MSQDTNVENLIINKLTKAQFESITTPDPTQLYFITDDNGITSLDDILISNLSNGQILKYNNTSQKWENANLPVVDQTYSGSSANAQSGVALSSYITQIGTNQSDISAIDALIPAQATTSNQLADKDFVNSSIATNTANFIGTFEDVTTLEAYTGTVTNNDYAFVINTVITDNGNDWSSFASLDARSKTDLTNFDYAWVINGTKFDIYRFDIVNQEWLLRASNIDKEDVSLNDVYNRYKASVSGSTVTWDFEYTLNNSSFTAEQWSAINSGITDDAVALISTALQPADLKTINGNSLIGSGNIVIDSLPSQTGQSGKFLTTNGTTANWSDVDSLPSQTGQSGKFLTTNGTTASWATVTIPTPTYDAVNERITW